MSESVDVLAPLRDRYAHWLGMDAAQVQADREQAVEDIRALQLVLRLERDRPPSWRRAVELAATATLQICLDPRATSPYGEWHQPLVDYCSGHIRKVTRRARASAWHAVQDRPGITLTEGNTQVRAFVPGRISEVDKSISKLQVGGTDAPYDEAEMAVDPRALQLWFPPAPVMTLGKSMAQAGHGSMLAAALMHDDPALPVWIANGGPCQASRVDRITWDRLMAEVSDPFRGWRDARLVAVRDAGFTEIDPGTVTVIAQAPVV